MLKIKDQVFYVEIKESQDTKRFVFPVEESLIVKLKSLGNVAPVSIVNQGTAIITESVLYEPSSNQTLNSIPSSVNSIFTLQFANHPDVTHGSARYSEELIEYVKKIEPLVLTPIVTHTENLPEPPPEKPKSLTEQLKQQVASNTNVVPLSTPVRKIPTLEETVAAARAEKGADKLPTQHSQPKENTFGTSFVVSEESNANILEILRIVKALEGSFNGVQKEVTGRDLMKWFNEYSYQHGADAAWDYLATKVSDF